MNQQLTNGGESRVLDSEKTIGTASRAMARIESENTVKTPEPSKNDGLLATIWRARNNRDENLNRRIALEQSNTFVGRFSAEVARRYFDLPKTELAKVLPEAWREGPLPKDPNERFGLVFEAAALVASRQLAGPAMGLDEDHSREARKRALVDALDADKDRKSSGAQVTKPLSALAQDATKHHIDAVKAEIGRNAPQRPAAARETTIQVERQPEMTRAASMAARAAQAGRGI